MKFDKYIKIGVLGIALWSLTGCTDWLDVQPVDQWRRNKCLLQKKDSVKG